jgi:hypothetical protein
VQLSLIPDQVPAPALSVLAQLPDQQVVAAVAVLATLIAKTVNPTLVPGVVEEAGSE